MWKKTKNSGNAIREKRSTCDGRMARHLFSFIGSSFISGESGIRILIRLLLLLLIEVANNEAVAAAALYAGDEWISRFDWSCNPF